MARKKSEYMHRREGPIQNPVHRLIPGGAHTYAKGDDQFPENAPRFIARGKGCHVWDTDGNEFIEYGMGLRSVTLGHGYERVVNAACEQMAFGSNYTRPSPLEFQCAELLVGIVDCGEQVKFAKDGSTVVSAALKLARAVTGRDLVAICGDHPFFSYDDWFIGSTNIPAGIPSAVRRMTLKFHFNDVDSLERLFLEHPDEIAAVVMEAAREREPSPGFLQKVAELCRQHGTLFVLDEMITGFRWDLRGAQHVYGIRPDLSTFGKAMSNGFALSALVGRRDIMERGGISHDEERVFLLSTTHGAENHALAATIETLRIYQEEPVVETLYEMGRRLRRGVEEITKYLDISEFFGVLGRDCNLVFYTRGGEGQPSQEFRTLFLQEMISRGILAPSFVVSYSHGEEDVDRTLEAVEASLKTYRLALENGIERYLRGAAVKPVYRPFC